MPCLVKALGLVSFAVVAATVEDAVVRAVALLVLANGLLCHVHGARDYVMWDVLCNVALAVLVNATSGSQPYTLGLTLLSGAAFAASAGHPNSLPHDLVHVLFVQAAGALGLALWRR